MDGEIEASHLEKKIEEDAPLVLDIRDREAYKTGHIPESINIPMSQLIQEVGEIVDADHIVTICPRGEASIQAARLIAAYEGFDGQVESLVGGLEAWEGPIESEAPQTSQSSRGS